FPYVFDSLAEAKTKSGFIAGSKLILPDGFEHESNEKCEEITIPHVPLSPVHYVDMVSIQELDEIGQLVFKGIKTLNLIQSIVYPIAYTSNENLLICAPTGAGKTNIAMLSILRELGMHLDNGIIKKNDFKIVYIAPMKALAAEMVRNFGTRLSVLGVQVMELTGDIQLTKTEISETQMIVTTPEKWDVVTRKSTGDVLLSQIVRLLIIDEVHLLHDDRGSVIESIVARTLRQAIVESSQTMIRIVGLSATLPNYLDVARFLRVNPNSGLFYFDTRFRPVPLSQTFVGIKALNHLKQLHDFNEICYNKVYEQVKKEHQVMVFVHARNETYRTAQTLLEFCKIKGHSEFFTAKRSPRLNEASKQFIRSGNQQMKELFPEGFAIHHAGMLRSDRNLVEKFFVEGLIKVIVCTATLAWGVNLPAHAVVIKGTQIYNAKKGSFVDLGILDVMQIFGRAGRPQYDIFGHGTILTTHDKLAYYLSLLTQQNPIESQFVNGLSDHLNAEISLGSVTTVNEGVRWLSYTYLFVRMKINPLAYGITFTELQNDPGLVKHRHELIVASARMLDKAHMIRFDEKSGSLHSTDLGRIASHFYIKYDSVEVFNEFLHPTIIDDKIYEMISRAHEFEQIKVRDEELVELNSHLTDACQVPVIGGTENSWGKVNILLQAFISRQPLDSFSLVSDQAYVVQNATRIARALFEIALKKGWSMAAGRLLKLSKVLEKRLWDWQNPIRQFSFVPTEIFNKLEEKGLSIDRLREMDSKEIGRHIIRNIRMGPSLKQCAHRIPLLDVDYLIQPITRTVLKITLLFTAAFDWNDKIHGKVGEPFWVWIEDPDSNNIYHYDFIIIYKKTVVTKTPQTLVFTIPIIEPLPSQYYIRLVSDKWLGSETTLPISFQHLILPERHPPHTELLDLQPLPKKALKDPVLESLYKFNHFNPIQTQVFHTLYHQDVNVLLGSPTGSGKTVAAELAIFRVFREYPKTKAVYIAPLKALVRERMEDWKIRIEQKLGKRVVELTGDVVPDMGAISKADLIVTTPEKWDGISRSWQTRKYVKSVSLLVIDEIHLLGDDRGPVLEVIVSRSNFISSHTDMKIRVVGLSTALANAKDLADWLSIKQIGLFNFRPSVRPVPLEVHISGYPGKHYCPRMATMNKPIFQAIITHSPTKPVLIFVSSRRQTRLTAFDLIAYLAAEENPKQWLHMSEPEASRVLNVTTSSLMECNLKLTMAFGIGLHHAGIHEKDRQIVEHLFVRRKIQVLIATSTLAWGVNFPAHLVIVKGTEYYDGKTKRYVDFPITDVLQMMGRAGRPQFDDQGKAVILVHDVKKHFYKKFLYEPFPVESSLLDVLTDHLNAEIVAESICSKQDAIDYITWTYFFRRLIINPSYYNLESVTPEKINKYLSALVQKSLNSLISSHCIDLGEDNFSVTSLTAGRISSYYYLQHSTIRGFYNSLQKDCDVFQLLKIFTDAEEFSQLPVRHNEDYINKELAYQLSVSVEHNTFDKSNTKALLLFWAYFSRTPLPSADYHTDLKSVMDQALRVLQAMLDMSAELNYLSTSLRVINLMQMVVQGQWVDDCSLLCLPFINNENKHHFRIELANSFKGCVVVGLADLMYVVDGWPNLIQKMLKPHFNSTQIDQIYKTVKQLPMMEIRFSMKMASQEDVDDAKFIPLFHQSLYMKKDSKWNEIKAGIEYILTIVLHRMNKEKKTSSYAYPTRFQKQKEECWILLLGDVENNSVLALKRVGFVQLEKSIQVSFVSPKKSGRHIYTLYIMSDCYVELDQQYDIFFHVL
ncbi:hypothetical protein HELRODRAFT_62279, partial [Helobdella robusta]|uniref:Activating signal cointegrator 1 complex subunit 3 n=1 Tax=Helobdella robusta TaxID=6412 RepID=T1FWY5_HELRO